MPLLVLSLTGSAFKAGLVGVADGLALLVAGLPAGVLADRLDRRVLMTVSTLVRAVAVGSVAVAFAIGRPPFAQLLLVSVLNGAFAAVFYVAERSLVATIVPTELLPDAVAVATARNAAAGVVGPPVGGALFGIARELPFIGDGLSYLALFAVLLGLRAPPRQRLEPRGRGLKTVVGEARDGFRWMWRQPFVRASGLVFAVANTTIRAVQLLALIILRRHGASSAAIGLSFALMSGGILAGSVIAGPLRRRIRTRFAVLVEPWSYVVFVPVLLVAHTPLAVGVLVGAMLVPLPLSDSVIITRWMVMAPDDLRSRVTASTGVLSTSLAWLGPLAAGALVQYTGIDTTVIAIAAWSALIAVAATLSRAFRTPD
jgi:MFS family permease